MLDGIHGFKNNIGTGDVPVPGKKLYELNAA
jgi:hypothetical protein